MDLFDVLALLGGLCLFLFGMNLMGEGLEKAAGSGLKNLLGRLTTGKTAGFFTGLGVTAAIQSSSATTVMVVGFVNSGLMTLRQAINVIMGANVGTTVTSWILSLTGIESDNIFIRLLKPTSFSPILALIGIIFYMSIKNRKRRDIGVILLGFAILMFGMNAMSSAVSGLRDVEWFRNILIMFSNPILGVLAGAILTGVIQSSSASVGILQALSSTGAVTLAAAIPIIMGQNIGTCATALISSVGTNRNARRASIVHLAFNVIGTFILLLIFTLLVSFVNMPFINNAANEFSIAVSHTVFNLLSTAIMFPAAGLLEKLSMRIIPEPKDNAKEEIILLDERLMATPSVAIGRCVSLTKKMADNCVKAFKGALFLIEEYSENLAEEIKENEKKADNYEDVLGSFLVKLNTFSMNDDDSIESAKLLHIIGDFERISDHSVNILESAQEIKEKGIKFTDKAHNELNVLLCAVDEVVELTVGAFKKNDVISAQKVEPLEQVVDDLKETLRARHIARLQKGESSIEVGFVWSDLLNNLERISDHCSNIAGCMIEMSHKSMDMHQYTTKLKRGNKEFLSLYEKYAKKYDIKKLND